MNHPNLGLYGPERPEPRHRAGPERDGWQPPDMSDYPDPHHHGQHRGSGNGNLTAGLILAVIGLIIAAALVLVALAAIGPMR